MSEDKMTQTTQPETLRERIMILKGKLSEDDKIVCDLAWKYLNEQDRKAAALEENLMMGRMPR